MNYKKTVVASLLHPHIDHYEVTPWPHRIYMGEYLGSDRSKKVPLPEDYGTTLLTVIDSLHHMPLGGTVSAPVGPLLNTRGNAAGGTQLEESSQPRMGVLVADSCMYQRLDLALDWHNIKEDERFASEMEHITWDAFFGLALPLLKHGAPVRPVQLDNIRRIPHYLSSYDILLLSYEFMKPEHMDVHYALTQWVQAGGVLLYVGDGSDPYHGVREWWNEGARVYANPAHHLFETLGVSSEAPPDNEARITQVGKGAFACLHEHPAAFAASEAGADRLREAVLAALQSVHGAEARWDRSHALIAYRGPYVAAALLDESVSNEPVRLEGPFVDLFDGRLAVRAHVVIQPGDQALLVDLNHAYAAMNDRPVLVAAAGRVTELPAVDSSGNEGACSMCRYSIRGPEGVRAMLRFAAAAAPGRVTVERDGKPYPHEWEWEAASSTFAVSFLHPAGGVRLTMEMG
ncbi:hypothetical protein [Paenibacillus apiarius]|uniref:hypothetical protein n=1 Tax=Paenibacillus apiarius TaxID=46240 RepID=UPI001F08EC7A|nr:hypothetical protein [Paenibacillus apiarius]